MGKQRAAGPTPGAKFGPVDGARQCTRDTHAGGAARRGTVELRARAGGEAAHVRVRVRVRGRVRVRVRVRVSRRPGCTRATAGRW